MAAKFAIGGNAWWRFGKDGSLAVAYHVTRTYSDGRIERGYLFKRKWLADRAAFDYDPTMGWAKEHWFEWLTVSEMVENGP